VDLPAPEGTGILAAEAGIVTFAGEREGYGRVVEVRHPGGLITRYAHVRRTLVEPGQWVARGQRIAEVGSTGRSTGPHLHLEVLKGGQAVAPALALKRYEGRAEIEGREESTHPPRRRAP
jgi:murein DD-endopeptidase MepM/ murein hydrolase activator NlpD